MGICQARDNRLDDAEASLLRSYQIDPSSAETAYTLADVQYRRGAYERARFYMDRVNKSPEQSNAQTLWLGARIEYKLGNRPLALGLGDQLRKRYPQSPETLALLSGTLRRASSMARASCACLWMLTPSRPSPLDCS